MAFFNSYQACTVLSADGRSTWLVPQSLSEGLANHDKPLITLSLRAAVPPDLCDKDDANCFHADHNNVAFSIELTL